MSTNYFLSTKNINLLWEVIKEEDILQQCSIEYMNHFKLFIQSTLHEFYDKEKNNIPDLKEMNKKYIYFIIQYVHHYLQNNNSVNKKKKDIYLKDNKPELVTFEEIQKERTTKFDRELQEKQQEFSNAIKYNVPETPNFSDKLDQPIDEPISLMERIIQQRIIEEELFKNSSLGSGSESGSGRESNQHNWIKPQETSIKNEKTIYSSYGSSIKYIKIEKEIIPDMKDIDIIDLNSSVKNPEIEFFKKEDSKKHISWKEDINNENNLPSLIEEYNSINVEKEMDIFSKFKKIEKKDDSGELKEEVKIIHTKLNELDNTINNILAWMKENKK